MTRQRALEVAQVWRTCQLDNGVRAASIELVPGVAGSGWFTDDFIRVLGHHIVSRRSQGLTPGRRLIEVGHGTLKGPLCNVYGGFDEVARLITLGWANHPGEGGPWPVAGWGTVPRDNGRPYILGTEFEGGQSEADWPDSFHDFMARTQAGNLDFIGWLQGRGPAPLECHGEHKTWADQKRLGRKIDRLGYTTASGRARIAAARTAPTPKQEDDMPLTQPEINAISDAVANRTIASVGGKPYHAWEAWRDAGLKGVDAKTLAAEIVAKLPASTPTTGGGLSKTDVESAVRAVFADAGSTA